MEEDDSFYAEDVDALDGADSDVDEPQRRISSITAGLMILSALLIDVVQWIIHLIDFAIITIIISLVLNILIDAGAWMMYYIWFRINRVDFIGPRQLLTFIGMGASEVATGGIVPAWTIGILLLLSFTKAEDFILKHTGKDVRVAKMLKPTSAPTKPLS